MKKTQKMVHTAAAILIDVLLVVLVLLAFVWMNESTKPASETKALPRPAAMRPLGNAFARAEVKSPTSVPPTMQVRYEGGRLVPIIAR